MLPLGLPCRILSLPNNDKQLAAKSAIHERHKMRNFLLSTWSTSAGSPIRPALHDNAETLDSMLDPADNRVNKTMLLNMTSSSFILSMPQCGSSRWLLIVP